MPDRCRWWPSVSCPLFWHCSQCRKDKPVYVAHGLALFSRLLRILVCWRWCVCSLCGGGVAYPLALRDVTGGASGDGGLQAWLVLALVGFVAIKVWCCCSTPNERRRYGRPRDWPHARYVIPAPCGMNGAP